MADPQPVTIPRAQRVFLSYAWEDEDYKLWVKRLATRLREDGVDARLDAWHLGKNDHIAEFMNREVRHADYVLVVCSPEYQRKVRATEDGTRVAGVGWETRLLSTGVLIDNENKVLAVLGRGAWKDSAPDGIRGQNRYDLSDPKTFEQNYCDLLRAITGTSEQAPPLGQLPADLEADPPSPLRGLDTPPSSHAAVSPVVPSTRRRDFARIRVIAPLAIVIDLALAVFVGQTLTLTAMTFVQMCALFSPVALVVAVVLSFAADMVRRRRLVRS